MTPARHRHQTSWDNRCVRSVLLVPPSRQHLRAMRRLLWLLLATVMWPVVSAELLSHHKVFVEAPHDVEVNSGSVTVLPCRLQPPLTSAASCQWTRDGYGLGTDPVLAHLPRYSMGSGGEHNCDLVISPTLPVDEGSYVCQAKGSHTLPARLVVNLEPGVPHIVEARDGGRLQAEVGELLELTCQSRGGRPFAELQWRHVGGSRVEVGDVEEHVTRIQGSSTFLTSSTLRVRVEGSLSVECVAHSAAFPALRPSAGLQVVVGDTVPREVVRLTEGQTLLLHCGDSDHTGATYSWFVNDKEIEGEKEQTLKMIDFTRSFDKSEVSCAASDSLGHKRTVKKFVLEHSLIGSPTARRLATSMRRKGTVMACVFEGNEEDEGRPEYIWVEEKLQKTITKSVTGSDSQNRKYKCHVIPGSYDKLKTKAKEMTKNMKKFYKFLKKFDIS